MVAKWLPKLQEPCSHQAERLKVEVGKKLGDRQQERTSLFILYQSVLPIDILLHISGQNWVSWPLLSVKVVRKVNIWLFKSLLRL